MSAVAFSPAPWRIHPDTDGGFSVVEIIAHNNTQVAQLESGTPDDEPITEADARLICAAPDLYEALDVTADALAALLRDVEAMTDWTNQALGVERKAIFAKILSDARAALAKADGR